jgi:hypothetical protein
VADRPARADETQTGAASPRLTLVRLLEMVRLSGPIVGWLVAAAFGLALVIFVIVVNASNSSSIVVVRVTNGPTVVSTQVVPLH